MPPVWVGLFCVSGPPSHPMLHGNVGAYLWIAAQAEDASKYRLRVTRTISELELTVTEDEQMQEVLNEDDLSEELAALIQEARHNVESVACGTWHMFNHHEA